MEEKKDENDIFTKRKSRKWDNDAKKMHQRVRDHLLSDLDLEQLEGIAQENGYCSLLHLYCGTRLKYTETVKLIIKSGGDVNKVDECGQTPIYKAILYKQGNDALSTMENLLNHIIVKKKSSQPKKTTLCGCISSDEDWYNDFSDEDEILLKRKDIANHKDKGGRTPLMVACKWGTFKKVKLLLELGADIKITYKPGLSAIYFASGSMSKDTLKFLLENVRSQAKEESIHFNIDMHSLSHDCCHSNCPDCSGVHLVSSAAISAFTMQNLDNFVYLLNKGFRINVRPVQLIEGQYTGEWIITLLSKEFLHPDEIGVHNNTTLQYTIIQEQNQAALYLLDQNNTGSENLLRALELSVKYRSIPLIINKIVQKLQSAGSDIPFETIYRKAGVWPCRTQNFTLLHVAIDYGVTLHVKKLLSMDPNYVGQLLDHQKGTTIAPFFLAMKHPHLWHVIDISRIFQYEQNIIPKNKLYEAVAGCFPRSDTISLPSLYYYKPDRTWLWFDCKLLSGEQLTDLLEENGVGPVFKSGENDQIATEVNNILQNVSELLVSKTKNPYLEFEPILSGSNSEGTKAMLPDEFDFLLVLSKLSNIMQVVVPKCCDTCPYVNFRLKSPPTVDMEFFRDGLFSKRDFFHMFEKEFMECLNSIKIPSNLSIVKTNYGIRNPKKMMTMSMRWLGDQHKDLVIAVDLSPAVCISPEDLKYNENISLPVMDKIPQLYAIFKESPRTCHPPDLRLSFSEMERAYITSASEVARRGYTLAKAMRSNLVCPHLQEPNTTNFATAEESIKTYDLKTCFFHLLKKYDSSEDVSDNAVYDDHVVSLVSVEWADKIYDLLEHYLREWNHVPHFFNPDWDVHFKELFTWEALEEYGEHQAQLYKQSIEVSLEHCRLIKEMLSSMKKHLRFRNKGKAEKELIYINNYFGTGFYTGPLEDKYLQSTPVTLFKFLGVVVLIAVIVVISLVIFKVM